jgi:hypothetical protein
MFHPVTAVPEQFFSRLAFELLGRIALTLALF